MLKPLDDAGLQFWWIDWQQGPFTTIPFLNPTFTLNYAYWTNPYRFGQYAITEARGQERPYVMGRWGGLGGHRYPIGFVGDTYSKWNVLKYELYFMSTASNVAFAWTHGVCLYACMTAGGGVGCCSDARRPPLAPLAATSETAPH